MAKRKTSAIRRLLNPQNLIIPVLIGLAAASYLLYTSFDRSAFVQLNWTWASTFWLFMAFLVVISRDLGYIIRIRILTNNEINWRNAFDVIMLWEFASAISPSVVGGSSVALIIVNKEGISLGRSTAVVMITALLDELFYLIMVPVVLLLVGIDDVFPVQLKKEIFGFTLGTKGIFVVGYIFIFVLTSTILTAVFINPQGFKLLLGKIFGLPFLRKWKKNALETGDEVIITSNELKKAPFSFWLKAFAATFFSWTARFWVVNFIILAFTSVHIGWHEHFLIYARQLVMWVIMLISPTPGSSGVAEFAFKGFLSTYIEPIGLVGSIILLWRLLAYYPYLFIGAIVIPNWVRRVYLGRRLIRFKNPKN